MDKKQKFLAITNVLETIFTSQKILRTLSPEYKWAGLGNLLGDYGECQAIPLYDLIKAKSGTHSHDAITRDGFTVQIKANHAAKQIGFRGKSDLMLVLHVDDLGRISEIYYGPFNLVYKNSTNSGRDNKKMISVTKLRKLQLLINGKKELLKLQILAKKGTVKGKKKVRVNG